MSRIALIAGAVTGLVLALAAGALLGRQAAPKPMATQVVHVGEADLVVPRSWHPVSSTKSAATLETSAGQAVVRLGPVRSPADSARATMLAGYRAWREGALTVLPTSTGIVTVQCATCADAVQAISVRGAAILDPTRDLTLALRAPGVVATLDRARVRGRDELRAATTPGGQSRWARRLADAHARAAAALQSVAGPDLLERFADVRSAYSGLALAATVGSAANFDAARARIRTAETKLIRSLGDIAPAPIQPRVARAPVVSRGVPTPLLALVIVVYVGLGAGLAMSHGRRRAEPTTDVPPWLASVQAPPPKPATPAPAPQRPAANGRTAIGVVASGVVASGAMANGAMANGRVAERPAARAAAAARPAVPAPAAESRLTSGSVAARAAVPERPAVPAPAAESRVASPAAAAHAAVPERPAVPAPAAESRVTSGPAAARADVAERPAARAQAAEWPAATREAATTRPATATERPPAARAAATERPAAPTQPPAERAEAAPQRPAVGEPAAKRPVAREAATQRPPAARRRPARRREAPVPLDATWTCELTWSANLRRAGFHAQAKAPGEKPVEVACSRALSWPPLIPPAPQQDLVGAARSVAKALVAAGWTPTTKGSDWYAQRFAWARDGSPPTLGTIAA